MPTVRCLICNNDGLLGYVNAGLDKGLSNRAIVAGLFAAGGKIDPEVVGRHKNNHWTKPKEPGAPQPTKRDLAIMLRDKVADALEKVPEVREPVYEDYEIDGKTYKRLVEPGSLGILDKDLAPALGMGLKAVAIIDKRQVEKNKLGLAAGALGFQMYLAGLGRESDPPELDDGMTIEGDAVEIA